MSIKTVFGLITLITALWSWPGSSSVALTMDEITRAKKYEQYVPENLRKLVTQSQFDRLATSLGESVQAHGSTTALDVDTIMRIAASPCGGSLSYLVTQFNANTIVPKALDAVARGLIDPPAGYRMRNPWKAASNGLELLSLIVDTFLQWCVFLPQISGSQNNGLAFIEKFEWLYFQNAAGQDFVQGRNPLEPTKPLPAGLRFTTEFSKERGAFMDSPASRTYISQWINDPRIEISDYRRRKPSDYQSWNEFFTRELVIDPERQTVPSRPATMPLRKHPDRDYIVVAPTDCIMNPLVQVLTESSTAKRQFIDNPLEYNTVLDVKGIPMSVAELLSGVPEKYKSPFVGGTGQSCVLMPNTYHHFHAPVNGRIVHAAVVPSGTYGYEDWPNWVPLDGNVGRPGTDFSQFQAFQRGIIVIEVKYADLDGSRLTGYVASVPVGLSTIGSIVLNADIVPGTMVKRGYTRLGNFSYGGSLNILLYSKGLAGGAVQTRMGNQINILRVGATPATK